MQGGILVCQEQSVISLPSRAAGLKHLGSVRARKKVDSPPRVSTCVMMTIASDISPRHVQFLARLDTFATYPTPAIGL